MQIPHHARWLTAEILGVALGVLFPLLGQIVERENRRNRAHRHAGAAINALDRIDVQHLFGRELIAVLLGVDAVHRTGIDAGCVFGVDARFRDHISHETVSPLLSNGAILAGVVITIVSKTAAVWYSESFPIQDEPEGELSFQYK